MLPKLNKLIHKKKKTWSFIGFVKRVVCSLWVLAVLARGLAAPKKGFQAESIVFVRMEGPSLLKDWKSRGLGLAVERRSVF